MRVKICGITRVDDALAAVEAGADALGFIFVRSSPRFISNEVARVIIQEIPPFVTPIGVFVDPTDADVRSNISATGIRYVQLHGNETPEFQMALPVPAYKAFRVDGGFQVSHLAKYPGPAYMLDTYVAGRGGGTGRSFDWKIAIEAKKSGLIILSGGITPANVGEAIREVAPFAIDVNSGVETAPGIKDRAKIRLLFEKIREAER